MRILIIDDHAVVREGLKRLLSERLETLDVGEAGTPEEARTLTDEQEWDVVLLDLSLGAASGFDILKDIKRRRPTLPVLILTVHPEERYARRAFRAGASGYVHKGSSRAELVQAIDRVMHGRRYVSPGFAETMVADMAFPAEEALHEGLSEREFEVLRLIASGKTVGQAAVLMALSHKTVSTYRSRLLDKMRMTTNAELTRYAIQNGLVD